MQTEQKPAKQKRMTWSDYAAVYVAQALPPGEVAPRSWSEVVEKYGRTDRELVDAAMNAADELFGEMCEDGTHLFKVKELSLAESAIASRMDLTHVEKIELIRPLRAEREAAANARYERPSKWEMAYRRGREENIASAVVETMAVSLEDRSWAAEIGLTLD